MTKITNLSPYLHKLCQAWLPLKIGYDFAPGIAVTVASQGKPVYSKAFHLSMQTCKQKKI